ncbi:MAG: ABC transporter permease, partial [Verrucomicrobia bacterium GWC2_42_7]
MAAFIVLGMMYGGALLAPFLAPYSSSMQNLERSFCPPTPIVVKDWKFQARMYEKESPYSNDYLPSTHTVPLAFFKKGEPYLLLGVIPMKRHFVQIKSSRTEDRLYLLGSDGTGRDIFSRLLYGSQVSLSIGLIGIAITLVMGFIVGGLSGYFGGRFDFAAMRVVEFLMAVPGLYLLLALRSVAASHFDSAQMYVAIVVILAFIGWATTARVIRGMSLSLRTRPFVLAAQSMGQSTFKILYKHILPNLASYLLVSATLSIPTYILGEAALSFLGLGIQE